MPPAVIMGLISLVETAIQEEPTIAAELQKIFAKTKATPADWMQAKANILAASYGSIVTNTQLPASATASPIQPS